LKFDFSLVREMALSLDANAPTGDPFLDARWDGHVAKFGHGKPYWRLFFRLCRELRPGTTATRATTRTGA
jgi:hypothetical protein